MKDFVRAAEVKSRGWEVACFECSIQLHHMKRIFWPVRQEWLRTTRCYEHRPQPVTATLKICWQTWPYDAALPATLTSLASLNQA